MTLFEGFSDVQMQRLYCGKSMINIFSKLLKKLEDVNNHVDKERAPKTLFKEIYREIDGAADAAKKLQQSIDILNKNDSDAVDVIRHELVMLDGDWAARFVHDYKELLEVLIGKYRKVCDRMDVFNPDE